MKRRAIVLLSGGLDSMLAIRIMQMQNIEVEAVNFKTVFACCQDQAGQAARELGVRLTVMKQEDDYLELIKDPKFGYGRGANPCIDCRAYMFRKAAACMEELDCSFIVSGEVVGQRPMSQKRRDLPIIAREAGLDDLLLRPLSAKLLPPTLPEREGIVDREQLYGISGRSRKELLELGRQLGLKNMPGPSTGCALTEPLFSNKVFDLVQLSPTAGRWEFEILKTGRHIRYDDETKYVVGKKHEDNEILRYLFGRDDSQASAMMLPANFSGPTVLVIGPATEQALDFANGLVVRYSKSIDPADATDDAQVTITTRDGSQSPLQQTVLAQAHAAAEQATPV